MIDLEFDTASAAESFHLALDNLWRNPEAQNVMVNPELRIVQTVESKEL
jgi:hypothetical protein